MDRLPVSRTAARGLFVIPLIDFYILPTDKSSLSSLATSMTCSCPWKGLQITILKRAFPTFSDPVSGTANPVSIWYAVLRSRVTNAFPARLLPHALHICNWLPSLPPVATHPCFTLSHTSSRYCPLYLRCCGVKGGIAIEREMGWLLHCWGIRRRRVGHRGADE